MLKKYHCNKKILNLKKMKITLLTILTLILFTSCSIQPECDNEESIGLAKELIIQEIKASIGTSYNMLGINIDLALEKFVDEITDLTHNSAGILSMANSGASTNGSQFFITHKQTPHLDGIHTVFGHVISGQEIVDQIAQNDIINSIVIIRKGKEAKKFKAEKVFKAYFDNKETNDKIQGEKNETAIKLIKAAVAEKQRIQAAIETQKLKEAKEKISKEFANAKITPSGLKYIVLQEGTGRQAVATSNVKVHYTGMFLDGKVFDSSVQRGQTIDFGLNQVIKGWTEGVQLMKEGAKYKFYIPANLAYGEKGAGGVIPPNTDLIFEIELFKLNN